MKGIILFIAGIFWKLIFGVGYLWMCAVQGLMTFFLVMDFIPQELTYLIAYLTFFKNISEIFGGHVATMSFLISNTLVGFMMDKIIHVSIDIYKLYKINKQKNMENKLNTSVFTRIKSFLKRFFGKRK